MPLANPVIVIPGITASNLRDEYPVSPEIVWSALLEKSYSRLTLHPDDVRYELEEPARVGADSVFGMPYGELIRELRHDLAEKSDEPVPVFPFAYDWRQPLELVESRLAAFVQEVIDRTRLLKHYDRSPWQEDPRVDLVGHSMGGLVVAGYLQSRPTPPPIGKVATLGTPFRGSCEAAIKVLTGTASLSPLEPNSREREAARLTPALYYLLPSFPDAVTDDGTGAAVDIFRVDAWQAGVLQTLAEFIRLHGLSAARSQRDRLDQARDLLSDLLERARSHRERVEGLALARAGLEPADWLAIAGVGSTTRVALRLTRKKGEVRYVLSSKDRADRWKDADRREETGDGTVPFLGAEPAFLPRSSLVCLSPEDLGYWEIGDRLLLGPVGWHGLLPKCNVVHRLIVRHFKGESGNDSVWGRPAPGVAPSDWRPPIAKLRRK